MTEDQQVLNILMRLEKKIDALEDYHKHAVPEEQQHIIIHRLMTELRDACIKYDTPLNEQVMDRNDHGSGYDLLIISIATARILSSFKLKMIDFLCQNGCSINVKSRRDTWSALHYAAREGAIDLIKGLLERGADPNQLKEDNYRSPLHLAVSNSHYEGVVALLEHGAQVDLKDSSGLTPLHIAVGQKDQRVITKLIESGADTSIPDENGNDLVSRAKDFDVNAGKGLTNGPFLESYLLARREHAELESLLQKDKALTPSEEVRDKKTSAPLVL